MKIEVKKIKLSKSLSEETPAYTASVFINDKHFADVSNHGTGGCDNVYPPKGTPMNDPAWNARLASVEQYIKDQFPKHSYVADGETHTYDESLEGVCQAAAWADDLMKSIKRDLASKVMFTKADGKVYQVKSKGAEQVRMIAVVKAMPTTVKILNELPIEEAAKLLGA